MNTTEWATLASTLAFAGFVLVTAYSCQQAVTKWPHRSREAFLCIGLFIMAFGVLAVVSRLSRPPFDLWNEQDTAILAALVIWGFFLIAAGSVLGRNDT